VSGWRVFAPELLRDPKRCPLISCTAMNVSRLTRGSKSPASNTGIKIIARSELKIHYAGGADPANHDLEWLHSLATALNTSSFAARLLGGTAAMMPAMNASTTTAARLVTGSRNTVSP